MRRRLLHLISAGCLGLTLLAAAPVFALAAQTDEEVEYVTLETAEDAEESEGGADETPEDTAGTSEESSDTEITAVYDETGGEVVVDEADLLTDSEESELRAYLKEISDRHKMDVAVVTKYGLDGRDIMDFADDYYDYQGYRPDGILLVLDMEGREYWMTTTGECINVFNDYDIEEIGDAFVGELSSGAYYDAFRTYGRYCDEEITDYENGTDNYYDTDEDDTWQEDYSGSSETYRDEPQTGLLAMGSGLLGLVVAAIVTMTMRAKLRSVHYERTAGYYEIPGSFNLTDHRDAFLYRHVDRIAKPKEQDRDHGGGHGGGGSIHIGGSGASHGGGGGHF